MGDNRQEQDGSCRLYEADFPFFITMSDDDVEVKAIMRDEEIVYLDSFSCCFYMTLVVIGEMVDAD